MRLDSHSDIAELVLNLLPFVFWKDINGVYRGGNENQAKVFGFNSPQDFVGKTIFEILNDYKSAKLIDDADRNIMKEKTVYTFEEKIMTPDGITRTFLSKKSPIFDENGEVIGLLGTAVDITAEKEAEQLRIANENQRIQLEINRDFDECLVELSHVFNKYKFGALNKKINSCSKDNKLNLDTKDINQFGEIKLTKREREIIYFLSLNKSPKEIAAILSVLENKPLSPLTISSIIDKQLYIKFNVNNVGKLLEVANKLKLVPFSIF